MSRRSLLSATLTATAAGIAGCSGARAREGSAKVRATTYIPPSYDDLYPGVELFLNAASETSGGLSFDLFDSGTLLSEEQLLPGLLLGVTDVTFQTSSYVTSTYPVLGAMQLPFVDNDFERTRRAVDPEGPLVTLMNERLANQNVRLLGGIPAGFECMWTLEAPIRKPEDVAGLRIRVAGEIEGTTVQALGGAPVFMGSSEVYEALERGTIDGLMSYVGTIISRDLQQIVKYGTVGRFGSYTVDSYCRKDWYDARSAGVRAALDEAGRVMYERGTTAMRAVHERNYLPAITEAGVELVELTKTELDSFRHAVEPVYEHWRSMLGSAHTAAEAIGMIERS